MPASIGNPEVISNYIEILMKTKDAVAQPPKHLRNHTAAWFVTVMKEYLLDSHHVLLLVKACEAWDRSEQAREVIAKLGMTYQERFGAPRATPEISIERDSRLAFCRILRELGFDVAPPSESRPNALRANR
jgi:phage terminase small subunit